MVNPLLLPLALIAVPAPTYLVPLMQENFKGTLGVQVIRTTQKADGIQREYKLKYTAKGRQTIPARLSLSTDERGRVNRVSYVQPIGNPMSDDAGYVAGYMTGFLIITPILCFGAKAEGISIDMVEGWLKSQLIVMDSDSATVRKSFGTTQLTFQKLPGQLLVTYTGKPGTKSCELEK